MKNILILDSEGKRVAVKYYSDEWPTNSAKLAFEKSLFGRTLKSNARTEGNHITRIRVLVLCMYRYITRACSFVFQVFSCI